MNQRSARFRIRLTSSQLLGTYHLQFELLRSNVRRETEATNNLILSAAAFTFGNHGNREFGNVMILLSPLQFSVKLC